MSTESNELALGAVPALHAARGGPAVTIGEQTLSWAELEARSTQRARQIEALGVRQGDFVTVALPNSFTFYEVTFAVWKLGAVPNVVSPNLPAPELAAILELARPRLMIADQSGVPSGVQVLRLVDQGHMKFSTEPMPVRISPYWKAMASGGSTGRPKIIVDHKSGVTDPKASWLRQPLAPTILNPGPLYHNAPFLSSHCALFTGGHVIDLVKFDAVQALEAIARHDVQWVNLVPTMMNRIWRLPAEDRQRYDMSSLQVVWHMASQCPAWLKEAWIQWLGPDRIFELYGGTEVQGTTMITGAEWLTHRGSVGRIQSGSRMQILDEEGKQCAPGTVGEIYFLPDGGRNSTYHYLGAEARSVGDWESLGDLGYLDDDGYLYLADRRTDLIISGGINIYPAEVEGVLDSHPAVATSAVVGLPDDDLGQRAHAIVQLAASATRDFGEEELRRFVNEHLVRYKVPRSFEFVSYPLRDDAGKTRRSALRDARISPQPLAPK